MQRLTNTRTLPPHACGPAQPPGPRPRGMRKGRLPRPQPRPQVPVQTLSPEGTQDAVQLLWAEPRSWCPCHSRQGRDDGVLSVLRKTGWRFSPVTPVCPVQKLLTACTCYSLLFSEVNRHRPEAEGTGHLCVPLGICRGSAPGMRSAKPNTSLRAPGENNGPPSFNFLPVSVRS